MDQKAMDRFFLQNCFLHSRMNQKLSPFHIVLCKLLKFLIAVCVYWLHIYCDQVSAHSLYNMVYLIYFFFLYQEERKLQRTRYSTHIWRDGYGQKYLYLPFCQVSINYLPILKMPKNYVTIDLMFSIIIVSCI